MALLPIVISNKATLMKFTISFSGNHRKMQLLYSLVLSAILYYPFDDWEKAYNRYLF